MTPKTIEDEVEADVMVSSPVQAQILSDEAEIAAGKPLRFRLPGPRANVKNKNRRIYPLQVLRDALKEAKPRIGAGQMISYLGHPPKVKLADGTYSFKPDIEKRAAKITAWFMDEHGQTFVDREIIPGPAGSVVESNIRAKVALATSMRGAGEIVQSVLSGETVRVAKTLELYGDDFVENPALETTWSQAVMLDEATVAELINSAPAPEVIQASAPKVASAAATPPASVNSPKLPDEQSQVITDETEANMRFRKNEKGELVLDENGTFDAKGNLIADTPAPPAPPAQAVAGDQTNNNNDEPKPKAAAAGIVLDAAQTEDFEEWRQERRENKAKAAVKTFLDDVFEGKDTHSPVDAKKAVAKMDLSRFTEDDLRDIREICDEASPAEVESLLTRTIALKDKEVARRKKSGMGMRSSAQGTTVGQTAIITDEHMPGKEHVEKILKAIDDHGRRSAGNYSLNPKLQQYNQTFIDSVISGTLNVFDQAQAFTDSVEHFLDEETTVARLLQQPTITPASIALLTQIYWNLVWLPMCGGIGPEGFNAGPGSDAGIGENLRIAVETRTSGARNLRVGENQAIPTVGTLLRWLNFMAEWRKLAFALTPEAQVQLQRGSARYDALGRQLFAISQIFAESMDLEFAHEHLNASDEFGAVDVVAEPHVDGDLITADADIRNLGYLPVADGGNIGVIIKITQKIPNHNTVQRPIVPERLTRVIQEDGSIQDALNTLQFKLEAKIGANPALVRGELGALDEAGTIIGIVDRPGDPDAKYAVDFENGLFLFRADSGVQAGAVPALTYSYATNFDVFDLGDSANAADLAIFYDGLLRRIDMTAAQMGSAPRFKPPNFAIFSLESAVFPEAARQAANLFKPEGTNVSVTAANPNNFGSRSGVGFMKVNTPWRAGSQRILLGQERSTKYGVQKPWEMQGPVHRYAIVGGVPHPTGTNFWFGQQNSVVATPVCYNRKPDGSIIQINHPYRTIKLVGNGKV
jgi:hypothetical protein